MKFEGILKSMDAEGREKHIPAIEIGKGRGREDVREQVISLHRLGERTPAFEAVTTPGVLNWRNSNETSVRYTIVFRRLSECGSIEDTHFA